MSSIQKRENGKWRARYRDESGKEHARHFARKTDAQTWLDEQTAKLVSGTHIAPRQARTTVGEWCDLWLESYKVNRDSTVRQARTHIARIKTAFEHMQLGAVRPSNVKTWCAQLKAEGLEDSYIYALHARLAQVYSDAVHDGLVVKSPCSRRTSPPMGKQRPYVCTTEQMWALYETLPAHLRVAVLLGAFVGLRDGEVCGLRVADVDFMRGIVTPAVQFPAEELKTETSKTPVPIPHSLALELSAHVAATPRRGDWLLANEWGQQLAPWTLQRAIRAARSGHVSPLPDDHCDDCAGCLVPGLPSDFRFHDLRHYMASMLIASGADVKVVQARMRHASAKTTLDTYAHLWPDADESTRAAVDVVMAARADCLRTAEGGGS